MVCMYCKIAEARINNYEEKEEKITKVKKEENNEEQLKLF